MRLPGPILYPDSSGACLQPKRKLTSTKNVWPWSYLAPWMEADMTQRQAARSGAAGTAGAEGSVGTDPYDNGLFMPLRQFIEEPIVQDLLHNGAALQVSGAVMPIVCLPVVYAQCQSWRAATYALRDCLVMAEQCALACSEVSSEGLSCQVCLMSATWKALL